MTQERLIVKGEMMMNWVLGKVRVQPSLQAKQCLIPHYLLCTRCDYTFGDNVESLSNFPLFKSANEGRLAPPLPSHLSFVVNLCFLT